MAKDNCPQTETKKQKAVRTWLEDENDHLWTDNHIAKQCGVSVPFVAARRRTCTKFAPPTRRKRLNEKGEIVWKITRANKRTKGKKNPPLPPIALREVRGSELNSLLSRLKTDVSELSTHTDASLIVVCAAEEFLEILTAYPPHKKLIEDVDAWGDTNEANEMHQPL